MDAESLRQYLHGLPHVEETVQWGGALVFWIGEKSIGGKMFAVANLESGQKCVASFAAGEEGMAELCERDGISPAPYLARAHWVCIERWDALTSAEWQFRLALAHRIITDSLPKRTRELLDMTLSRRRQAIRAHKRRRHSPRYCIAFTRSLSYCSRVEACPKTYRLIKRKNTLLT